MVVKHNLVAILYFLCTAVALKFLFLVLPLSVSDYYFLIANFLLCVIIANLSFGFSKILFLNERLPSSGKAVLITGSARGIGYAVAKHLDARGYQVFASCKNPNSPGANDLRKNCSSRLTILPLDVTDDESVRKGVDFVKNNLGVCELWAVINNAGIQNGCLTEFTTIKDFKDSLDVNTLGQIRITKAFLPLLRKSKGRIINMDSVAGRTTMPFVGPYSVCKFASVGFSEYIRYELDMWGIKVVSIEPEFFETDMTDPKQIKSRLAEVFATIDEDVRRDYGEEYLKAIMDKSTTLVRPSPNMYKVIDAVDEAVSLKHPDAVYTVSRNMFVSVILKVAYLTPIAWRLLVARIFLYIIGAPKPGTFNKMD